MIFVGDFKQILVVKNASEEDIVDTSLIHSEYYKNLTHFKLKYNQRCKFDKEYSDFLEKISKTKGDIDLKILQKKLK